MHTTSPRECASTDPQPIYTESSYGYKFRPLDVRPGEGYAAATRALRRNEQLFRKMCGEDPIGGDPRPVMIENEVDFDDCVNHMDRGEWIFQLFAGIHICPKLPIPAAG